MEQKDNLEEPGTASTVVVPYIRSEQKMVLHDSSAMPTALGIKGLLSLWLKV